ncbi:MAG: S-methyl-5'-thioadenosine phosphorylase [Akkermansiaceae bacterium]
MNTIGIIGGSGLYAMEGFEQAEENWIDTPYGKPSDALIGGEISGRQVWFLPRHGRGHTVMPHEINHRANIWALRSVGVRWLICVTAVGSLKENYVPRQIVLPDQYYDRTSRRDQHTFFGDGIAAHVGFGKPVSSKLRAILKESAIDQDCVVHDGGTYVNMDGPAFSTRAESEAYRSLGFDIIGMTNLAEAKLAREAEIALATLCMVTDYDCWHEAEEDVSVETVIENLHANAANAQKIVAKAVAEIPQEPNWPEHDALAPALMTPRDYWPEDTAQRLQPILQKYV